jgi:membrane protease YdiL (CAAX protease family)
MTAGVLGLGAFALAAEPAIRRERPRARDLPLGLASAATLYGIFLAGDRLARRIMPHGASEIDAIYALRRQAPRLAIAAALTCVIGPGEELFWRGLIQRSLQQRLGRTGAAAVGSALYGGIHLVSENLTLTGAAAVAGVFWSLLYASEQRLSPLIVSHVAWDLWIFLVAPTA